MSGLIKVQGVVLSTMPIGDYDKRMVLLTKERGKISAFARGARKPNSPYMAAVNSFVFGEFTLYEGRNSYTLKEVAPLHQFVELAAAQPEVYYGYYFLELADYFGREGTDEKGMMNLLYVSVKALLNPGIDNRLIRCVFELRTMAEQGLCPQLFHCVSCGKKQEEKVFFSMESGGILCSDCAAGKKKMSQVSADALYTMRYIISEQMGKLYTFRVSESVLKELEEIISVYLRYYVEKKMKSLEILKMMCRNI